MNTEFAEEKSIYSRALNIFMNLDNAEGDRMQAYVIMQGVEDLLIEENDEIAIVVTTLKTNPMKDVTAPPMEFEVPGVACSNCGKPVLECICEAPNE